MSIIRGRRRVLAIAAAAAGLALVATGCSSGSTDAGSAQYRVHQRN
jgi:hypothetical protein